MYFNKNKWIHFWSTKVDELLIHKSLNYHWLSFEFVRHSKIFRTFEFTIVYFFETLEIFEKLFRYFELSLTIFWNFQFFETFKPYMTIQIFEKYEIILRHSKCLLIKENLWDILNYHCLYYESWYFCSD